jgi:hypothetical protein
MVKRQQTRWTPRRAHLLLQVRTRVLDDELTAAFRRWYSSFDHVPDSRELAARPLRSQRLVTPSRRPRS